MEVMSYTYYLCLVIIVFSHYVSSLSTERQEEGSIEESGVTDIVDQTNSAGNKVDQTSSAENKVDQTSSAENKVDRTSSAENKLDQTSSAENKVDQTSSAENKVDQTRSAENKVDQTSSAENKVEQTSSAENKVSQTSSAENKVDQTSSTEVNEKIPATFSWQSGIVPFVIKRRSYDPIITQRIRMAMQTIEASSCVVFKDMEREPPPEHFAATTLLSIENPEGVRECSHTTMREQGVMGVLVTKAILVIGYDCMTQRDILHALLHALGFRDEVTHPQRDLYIRVMWANIQPRYRKLFWMRTGEPPHKMVEYDSMSIMHFHDRAFSVNGGATIMPLVPGLIISPSDTLSQIDVMKLRLAFGHECKKRKVDNLLQTCHNALISDDEEQLDPEDPTDPENPTDHEDPTDPEGSTDPEDPTDPESPTYLVGPTDHEDPTDPEDPTAPEGPTYPGGPTDHEDPTHPGGPTESEGPTDPEDPTDPEGPRYPGGPTSPEGPTLPEDPKDPEGPTDPGGPTESEGPTEPEGPTDHEGPSLPQLGKRYRKKRGQ